LVFVGSDGSLAGLYDGVAYVMNYAIGTGQPAVSNLSWGTHVGPHDGTSALDQAFNQLANPALGSGLPNGLIVGAAGNEGEDFIHIQQVSSPKSDTLTTTVAIIPSGTSSADTIYIDVWGSPNKPYSIKVDFVDQFTNIQLSSTGFLNTANYTLNDSLSVHSFSSTATLYFDPNNQFKPYIQIFIGQQIIYNSFQRYR